MVKTLVPPFSHYIVVSTEDHIRLVKGGIGTYLGLLFKYISIYFPQVYFIWITESPTKKFEVIKGNKYRIFYIPNTSDQKTLFQKLEKNCERIYKLFSLNKKNKIVIEAPDWEGILGTLYQRIKNKNVFKVTRLHSILELTHQNQEIKEKEEKDQVKREHLQCLSADLLASSTEYAYQYTKKIFSSSTFNKIPYCVIPNFINENFIITGNRKTAEKMFSKYCPKEKILSENKNVFIVGSVEKRKGIDLAIKIAIKVCQQIPKVHFYVLGHLETKKKHLTLNIKYTKAEISRLITKKFKNRIHICGYFPYEHLNEIYPLSDSFLFCYLHDNFPGALAEAALSGKNVVYLDRAGCHEMMKYKKSQLGLPFNGTGDDEVILEGVKSLLQSLKNSKKYSAISIKDKYHHHQIMKKICHAYQF